MYGFTIGIIVSEDRQRVIDELNAHFKYPTDKIAPYILSDFDLAICGKFMSEKGCKSIIWLPHPPSSPEEHATLAHEVLHAVGYIARWVGLKFSDKSEEAFCYLQGWLTEQIYQKINNEPS